MEDGRIKDSQITTTGVATGTEAYGANARLNKNISPYGAWCAYVDAGSDTAKKYDQYIQIDLLNLTIVTGIATQGLEYRNQTRYVKDYKISYSTDSRKWIFYREKDQTSNGAKVDVYARI